MKKNNLKTFTHYAYEAVKDNEGTVTAGYSDTPESDKALFWNQSSVIQSQEYGTRINSIVNMHYYGKLAISELDKIVYEGTDYRVISVRQERKFKIIEIERIL